MHVGDIRRKVFLCSESLMEYVEKDRSGNIRFPWIGMQVEKTCKLKKHASLQNLSLLCLLLMLSDHFSHGCVKNTFGIACTRSPHAG